MKTNTNNLIFFMCFALSQLSLARTVGSYGAALIDLVDATTGRAYIPLEEAVVLSQPFGLQGVTPSIPMGNQALFENEMFLRQTGTTYTLYLTLPEETLTFSLSTDRQNYRPHHCDSRFNRVLPIASDDVRLFPMGADKLTYYRFNSTTGRLLEFHSSQAVGPTRYQYNSAGKLTSIVDALNQTTSFQYGANGLLEYVNYPSGIRIRYQYSGDQKLTGIIGPDGNLYTLTWATQNGNPLPTQISDARSEVSTRFFYGQDFKLWYYQPVRGQKVGQKTYFGYPDAQTFEYNTAAKSTTLTFNADKWVSYSNDDGLRKQFSYNERGCLASESESLVGANGQQIYQTTLTYDYQSTVNLPTFVRKNGVKVVETQYDAATGKATRSTDIAGKVSEQILDGNGLASQKKIGPHTVNIRRNGTLPEQVDSSIGTRVSAQRDNDGSVTRIERNGVTTTIQYQKLGSQKVPSSVSSAGNTVNLAQSVSPITNSASVSLVNAPPQELRKSQKYGGEESSVAEGASNKQETSVAPEGIMLRSTNLEGGLSFQTSNPQETTCNNTTATNAVACEEEIKCIDGAKATQPSSGSSTSSCNPSYQCSGAGAIYQPPGSTSVPLCLPSSLSSELITKIFSGASLSVLECQQFCGGVIDPTTGVCHPGCAHAQLISQCN